MKEWYSKKRPTDLMHCKRQDYNCPDISINLFIVGFVSTSIQLLLMREIMNLSGGYELMTGIFLGSWLTASAGGSALAGRTCLNDLRIINLVFSLGPLLSVLLFVLLAGMMTLPGETPDFLKSLVLTFLMLLPVCFSTGYTFIKLTAYAVTNNDYKPGKSFSIETGGAIIAGIILSVLTSGILNTGQILVVILITSPAYTLLTYFPGSRLKNNVIKSVVVIIVAALLIIQPHILLRQVLMPGIKIKDTRDTPYGNITRGIYGDEESIYYNQRLLSYSDDAMEREENIHYALLQVENPVNILVISGSLASFLPEIAKYDPEKVIFIENDPGLIETTSVNADAFPFSIDIKTKDAYRYIRENELKNDAVILLLPPPSSLALNRYYTREFFKEVKSGLSPGGIFMCSPGPADYYLNKETVYLYSSVYNSLTEVFRSVKPVPGNKLYFVASDSELSVSYSKMAERKQINNIYVSQDFLSDDLIRMKSDEILSVLDKNVRQNRSASPIACFYYQSYNLSRNPTAKSIAAIILIVAFALSISVVRRNNILMYFTASSLAGFEIIILLILQLTIGNMYQLTGIIIAALMTGLAAGSGMKHDLTRIRVLTFALLLYYLIIAILTNAFLSLSGIAGTILIISAVLPPSFITGNLFRRLTINDEKGNISSSVYTADLAGSALGFILISALIVPVFGIRFSLFFLSGLIFAGILFGTDRKL